MIRKPADISQDGEDDGPTRVVPRAAVEMARQSESLRAATKSAPPGVLAQLDRATKRIEQIARQAQTPLPPADATALGGELLGIEAIANEVGVPSLAAIAKALRGQMTRGARGRVLVISPERAGGAAADALMRRGFDVRAAANLRDFVALFGEAKPDVVVTEIELPQAPAAHLARFVREIVGEVPVLFHGDPPSGLRGADLVAAVEERRAGTD
jgi:hypothetical protein